MDQLKMNEAQVQKRYQRLSEIHVYQREDWKQQEIMEESTITPEWLAVCIRNVIDDETIILDETITNTMTVSKHLPCTKAGTYYGSGGTSLGWNGGAAIGIKLADPASTVVALTGDGTYLFNHPSSVYWISRRYQTPFLTIIFNNEGWNATKMNLIKRYPEGVANQTDRYWVNFDQSADLAKIAEAAGGAYARSVTDPAELQKVLQDAMYEVKNGRSAVVDVRLAKISNQKDL
jgi:acetolactate synthase-1/2/3 large subunit